MPPVLLLTSEAMAPPPGVDRVVRIDPVPFEAAKRCNYAMGGLSYYFKLALFGIEEWKRIVYIDSDTIALSDLSELWDLRRFADKPIYAMRETAEMAPWGEALGKLNTGVMVINAPMLSRRVYLEMMEQMRAGRSYDGGDQGIINAFLAHHRAEFEPGELPQEYNLFVNESITARWPRIGADAKVLHFVGKTKPWSRHYERAYAFGPKFKPLWEDAARYAVREASGARECSVSAEEI
jgi:lipopolysaccharide biosynthesis glycosyltransferase